MIQLITRILVWIFQSLVVSNTAICFFVCSTAVGLVVLNELTMAL
jgi:hypothetical protein